MHSRPGPRSPLTPVTVVPPRALGVITGAGFTLCALVFAFLALRTAAGAPAEFKTFLAWLVGAVLVAVALVFANWTYGVATLAYEVRPEALVVRWGFRRVVVPIESIQRMVPGRTLDEARVAGLNWWGCHVGHADVKRIGYTIFYSTHSSPDELLYVVTTGETYALTVVDQAAFAEEIQARSALGTVPGPPQRSSAVGMAAFPFWRDHAALWAAGLSVLTTAAMTGYVFTQYPSLPDVVQLDFPQFGDIVRIGDKSELLRIAYLGAGIMAVNLVLGIFVHARERAAGLWLLASGGMLQGVLLAAAVVAVQHA